jgi:signal recognition particle subunit SRP72
MPPKTAAAPKPGGAKAPKAKTARAKTPKEPLPPAERLKRLFTSLCAQIDGGHLQNALKTCDKSASPKRILVILVSNMLPVLRIEPEDKDATQTKLFLLLQTEQYDNALALVDGQSSRGYENAYALYRLQREDDARAVLEKTETEADVDQRGVSHLEAQMVCNGSFVFQGCRLSTIFTFAGLSQWGLSDGRGHLYTAAGYLRPSMFSPLLTRPF